MPETPGVHHHLLLERSGGAARVARLLAMRQQLRRPVSLSFELGEPCDTPFPVSARQCDGEELASTVPEGCIVHVHATRDWRGLLAGFKRAPRPLVITVHDCAILTGGCVYPVFCGKFGEGCPDPCPRGYADAWRVRREIREAVTSVRPVLVSPSAWLSGLLKERWPDIPVKTIPNGIVLPDESVGKAQARARLGIASPARVVLFMAHGGLQASYKGGDKVLSILERISELVPGTLGVVAGGTRMERSSGVLFMPYVEGELLDCLYGASDVLLYPTLADNHPLILLEAMAHGLPIAAYSVGGVPEQVVDGENGLLVRVTDEERLVRAAADILLSPALAKRMGDSGRERAEKHFSVDRMTQAYERIYAALAARG